MNNIELEQNIENIELNLGEDLIEVNLQGGVRGKQGEIGPEGPQGKPGPANIIGIGTVTSGTTPSANISGESPNQTLNLVLPKGDPGTDGVNGQDGEDGIGIESIEQTTTSEESGGSNVITVTMTDGNTSEFVVKNGTKGEDGESYDDTEVRTLISNKVDKVANMGLSENNFTDIDKSNLNSNTSARHTHTNKQILDQTTAPYTTVDKSNLDNNTNARHIHPNKPTLDNISSSDVDNWNHKADISDIPDVSQFITKAVNDLVNYYAKNESYSKTEVNQLLANIDIPTALSQLTEDSTHRTVTDTEKQVWNSKSDFSGYYKDITDKPKINDVELVSNKTSEELGLASKEDVEKLSNNKVDKEYGKGLSANDFTNDDKDKLSSLSNDYNNFKNIPQIKILNSVDDEVIIDIKGIKKLQELGIAPFRLLDMTDYTNSNPLIPIDNIIDGTYMTINDGYIKTSTENLKLVSNSILIKFDTSLTIITDSGNYWYTYSADGYEGGYAITYNEVESMLSSFIVQKSLITNNATTIVLNNNFWYQKNISTGLTKLSQIIPATIDTYYEAKVSLNTSSTSFTNTIQNSSKYKLKFVGLDCENGEWNPRTNMRYNLDYYFDGGYIVCNVTGFERS